MAWISEVLAGMAVTFASSAVRLSQVALDAGMDLEGAHFTLAGEPITAARLSAVRRAGGTAAPRYGTIETGPISYACLAPQAPDDVHLLHDLHAAVQVEAGLRPAPLVPPGGLLLTSLLPSAPRRQPVATAAGEILHLVGRPPDRPADPR
jgi:hypothetical protein